MNLNVVYTYIFYINLNVIFIFYIDLSVIWKVSIFHGFITTNQYTYKKYMYALKDIS